jgi:superfamily II DNA helicase RecQ
MHDQVSGLKEKGIEAASLCSTTPPAEVAEVCNPNQMATHTSDKQIKRQLVMGHPYLRLLYTTPETLFGARYEQYFQRCYSQKQLVRLVIDEVRSIQISCVS